jgi:hypothetical protein
MTKYEKINTLIETRINGNNITKNNTYVNMVNSLRSKDILNFCMENYPEFSFVYRIYKKADKISALADLISGSDIDEVRINYNVEIL